MQMVAFWPLPWAVIEARQSTAAALVNSYHNGQSSTSVDLLHAIDLLIFHFQFVLNNTELVHPEISFPHLASYLDGVGNRPGKLFTSKPMHLLECFSILLWKLK
jgi:hypothetical protein